MASTQAPLHDFVLTPQQQNLLFAALNSTNPQADGLPDKSSSGKPLDMDTLQDSSYLDYDYSFDNADSSFDFSFNQADANNDGPSAPSANGGSDSASPETESPDKRSHPDDDELEDNGGKRHESSEKVPKKPGRKPLMSEPSSKRKAQNRAAQRAFRERKEKHLKDLEDKVEELQKTADTAKTENTELKAKIDKMTIELNEYKKKLNSGSGTKAGAGVVRSTASFGNPLMSNINDVSFQFEFPKFGQLPGPPASTNTGLNSMPPRTSSSSQSPLGGGFSLGNQMRNDKPSPASSSYTAGLDSQTKEDIAKFSGIFSPPLTNNNLSNASRASLDSHFGSLAAGSTSSPSASSNSHVGPSSSCGTSPEPSTQSPMGFKPLDTLTTIGEEQPSLFSTNQDFGHFSSVDFNDVSWLAAQNNFQFDPQIFSDYRDPQQNIIAATGGFDDSFFNDAFEADFTTPYNMPLVAPPSQAKTNILNQIDAAKEADDDAGALLTCNGIWERLQGCPKVRDGDFDLDGLCADLQKKAKCSGSGAVIDEKDFKTVMGKYLNPDGSSPCPDLLKKT